jgi:hypothetical protein
MAVQKESIRQSLSKYCIGGAAEGFEAGAQHCATWSGSWLKGPLWQQFPQIKSGKDGQRELREV